MDLFIPWNWSFLPFTLVTPLTFSVNKLLVQLSRKFSFWWELLLIHSWEWLHSYGSMIVSYLVSSRNVMVQLIHWKVSSLGTWWCNSYIEKCHLPCFLEMIVIYQFSSLKLTLRWEDNYTPLAVMNVLNH